MLDEETLVFGLMELQHGNLGLRENRIIKYIIVSYV
jgi:hypothetical protein